MTRCQVEQAEASTRIAPSRQFMVQQAVLNAAAIEYPVNLKHYGIIQAIRALNYACKWSPNFAKAAILREYRLLAAYYQVAA